MTASRPASVREIVYGNAITTMRRYESRSSGARADVSKNKKAAWPFGVAVTPNAVDAYVHYLRDKLGPAGELIRTVRGIGYRLSDG